MQYAYHRPDPLLNSLVQTVLVIGNGTANNSSDLPLFTNGMPALVYKSGYAVGDPKACDDKISHTITIYGQSIAPETLAANGNTNLIAFLFRPFALAPLFKLGAKELNQSAVDLSNWNAHKWMAIRVQLMHAVSLEERIGILNHFLVSQWSANKRDCEIIQFATDRIIANPEPAVLTEIVQKLNLTERTFQRVFKQYTGVSANQYRRICQFYGAFSQLKDKHFDKQTDVAYDNNYFDQSHYIRSFKEFTSTTPNDYLQFGLKGKEE